MKLARLLVLPTLLLACCQSASAQMPGYGAPGMMMPQGNPYPGQPMSFADPMPGGVAPDGAMPAPMAAGAQPELNSGAFPRYGYISIDALYWDRKTGGAVDIARPTSNTAATFETGASLNYEFEVLPRLTAGFVLANGVAVEGTYFYKDNFAIRQGLAAPGNINMTALGSNPAGSSFNNADWLGVNVTGKIQSGEINVVETERFFNFLAGFRWIELQDRADLVTYGANGDGYLGVGTHNNMLGGQVGVRMAHSWGLVGLEAMAKTGLLYNDAKSKTTISDVGTPNATPTRNASGNNETFLAEVQLMATFRQTASFQYRLGYNAMFLGQTTLAVDQFRATPQTGVSLYSKSDLLYHGPFAGAEFRW